MALNRRPEYWTRAEKARMRELAKEGVGPKAASSHFPDRHPDAVRWQYYDVQNPRKYRKRHHTTLVSTTVGDELHGFLTEESRERNISMSSLLREALRYYRDGLTSGAPRATLVHHTERSK